VIEDPNVHHFKGTSGCAPVGRFYDAHKVRIAWNIDGDGRVSSVFLTDDFDEWLGNWNDIARVVEIATEIG
jgi:hypothetical protein